MTCWQPAHAHRQRRTAHLHLWASAGTVDASHTDAAAAHLPAARRTRPRPERLWGRATLCRRRRQPRVPGRLRPQRQHDPVRRSERDGDVHPQPGLECRKPSDQRQWGDEREFVYDGACSEAGTGIASKPRWAA